jgi:hypothetical protein
MILQSDNRRLRAGPARRGDTKVSNYDVGLVISGDATNHFVPTIYGDRYP